MPRKNIWDHLLKNVPVPIDPLRRSLDKQLLPAILKLPGMKQTFPVAVTRETLKKNLDILGVASPQVVQAMRDGTLKTLNLTAKQLNKIVKEASKRTTETFTRPPPLASLAKPSPARLPGSFGNKSNVVPLQPGPRLQTNLQKQWTEMGKGVTRLSDVRGKPSIAGVEKPLRTATEKVVSSKDKLERFMRNIDKPGHSEDKAIYQALKKTQVGKNVVNLGEYKLKNPGKPFKFPKARGGKIKNGYARGGGIRKPKW